MIDTHTHINMIEVTPADDIIKNAGNYGVDKLIIPAASTSDFDTIIELTNKHENVYGMLGIHPSEAKEWTDDIITRIKKLANKNKKIVAIGEIGLDYYWDKSFNDLQKEIFIKQIKLANELRLPIDVHDRDAHKDTFDILKEYNRGSIVIMHCFSGSVEFAKECIKEGWYLGIGGVVTFKNAIKMKEVARAVPLEQILLETDAPYLTPVPYRGKENQPAYVKFVAEEIARIRNTTFEEIDEIATQNAKRVFNI